MCNVFYQAADLATDGDDKTRLVIYWIKRLTNQLSEGRNSSGSRELTSMPVSKPHTSSNGDINHTGNENGIIRCLLAANRKGRPPETKKQPIVEKDFGRSYDPNGGTLSHGSTLNPYSGASYPSQVQ
ncbi:hypothetical protein FRX31_034374, partial [Thalictrum thalictroides]